MFAVLQDPTSLNNLHDLVVPDPPPAWPPAAGWYVLLSLLLVLATWVVIKMVLIYRANAYRRTALTELKQIKRDAQSEDKRSTVVPRLNQLLKRVALAGWTREEVASRSGADWLRFLNGTGKKPAIAPEKMELVRDSAYSTRIRQQISTELLDELLQRAEEWIRLHQSIVADTSIAGDTSKAQSKQEVESTP